MPTVVLQDLTGTHRQYDASQAISPCLLDLWVLPGCLPRSIFDQ
jgi:hypothetical protein